MNEENYDGPELPKGIKRNRGGWQGEDLEMEHSRDASQSGKRKNVAAVHVEQFQNHVVGKGYQAKHVIRQKTGKEKVAAAIVDMTGGKAAKESSSSSQTQPSSKFNRKTYIQCKGLREFRREIEKILSSA
jgi:hypothetical protein